jgi:hypothetical protein
MNKRPIIWPEFVLRFVPGCFGIVSMFALVAVFMPCAWMDMIHKDFGMGTLPSEPIVGCLARSLSLFYALMGGLLLACSFDLHRHRTILCYMGAAFLFFGIVMWGVDFVERMPRYWKNAEGPMVAVIGALILYLALRLKKSAAGIETRR